ncbi:hypothetical protein ACA910_015700 [Epithemia clementina (nom. ined.)]
MIQHTFENADMAFSMSVGYRLFSTANGDGGEGMAFVIHQDSRGLTALGGSGGSLGVHGPRAINPGFIIEWDTQSSGGSELLDQGGRNVHVLVRKNQTLTEIDEVKRNDMRTGLTPGRMWVHYCANGTLTIFLNNLGDAKPAAPVMTKQVNLKDLFVGQNVFLGYTAATSSQKTDNQDITSWQFTEDCNEPF